MKPLKKLLGIIKEIGSTGGEMAKKKAAKSTPAAKSKSATKTQAKTPAKTAAKSPAKATQKVAAKTPAKVSAKAAPSKVATKPEKTSAKQTAKASPKAATKPASKVSPAANLKADPKSSKAPAVKASKAKADSKEEKSKDSKAKPKMDVDTAVAQLLNHKKQTDAKAKKAPSIMGKSKTSKDEDDEFMDDDDIEMDPELQEFVDDVADLDDMDADAESDSEEQEEEEAPASKKTPKEKSATERRVKKERDLLAGIDRNGDLSQIWQKFYDAHKSEKAQNYNMREVFEARKPIQHVKLGWGFVLSNINDRLEVLFKEGIKVLISNYKG